MQARALKPEALIVQTDVTAAWDRFGDPDARAIRVASPLAAGDLEIAAGPMGPKVEAARAFAEAGEGWAAIGRLEDAMAIPCRKAGTRVDATAREIASYTEAPQWQQAVLWHRVLPIFRNP